MRPPILNSFAIMSKRLKDSLPFLQVLIRCKPKLRKAILEHGPGHVLMSICECSHNVLKGVIPLTPSQKQRMSRYKKHLRTLADKKVSRVRKRRLLSQKGGNILTILIPTVLSAISSLLTK